MLQEAAESLRGLGRKVRRNQGPTRKFLGVPSYCSKFVPPCVWSLGSYQGTSSRVLMQGNNATSRISEQCKCKGIIFEDFF